MFRVWTNKYFFNNSFGSDIANKFPFFEILISLAVGTLRLTQEVVSLVDDDHAVAEAETDGLPGAGRIL